MTIARIDPADYRGTIIPDAANAETIARSVADTRIMVLTVLQTMLDRYERNPAYPFIDTKLSVLTGRDFDADDLIAGRDRIYGWIQGRGLEALAGHHQWLRRTACVSESLRERLCGRIRTMLSEVLGRMENLRGVNAGRLWFVMTPEGRALEMGPDGDLVGRDLPADGPSNYTELFYVKGMAAAASVLGDDAVLAEAREGYARIDRDLWEGRFRSDQQPLDPTNTAIAAVEGRNPHGPRMIAIGAAARFLECTGEAAYLDMGLAYIDHILDVHTNADGRDERIQPYDMWEFVDDAGRPFLDDGRVLRCDGGHACEFVGLSMKLLRVAEQRGVIDRIAPARLAGYRAILPEVLARNFANGFAAGKIGIAKAVDLLTREVVHSDMPWWSLPETMRAAVEVCRVIADDRTGRFAEIARLCANAFAANYVRRDLHLMAYQTLDASGAPVAAVPGMPDADPGYHTGLSLIDCLDLWDNA